MNSLPSFAVNEQQSSSSNNVSSSAPSSSVHSNSVLPVIINNNSIDTNQLILLLFSSIEEIKKNMTSIHHKLNLLLPESRKGFSRFKGDIKEHELQDEFKLSTINSRKPDNALIQSSRAEPKLTNQRLLLRECIIRLHKTGSLLDGSLYGDKKEKVSGCWIKRAYDYVMTLRNTDPGLNGKEIALFAHVDYKTFRTEIGEVRGKLKKQKNKLNETKFMKELDGISINIQQFQQPQHYISSLILRDQIHQEPNSPHGSQIEEIESLPNIREPIQEQKNDELEVMQLLDDDDQGDIFDELNSISSEEERDNEASPAIQSVIEVSTSSDEDVDEDNSPRPSLSPIPRRKRSSELDNLKSDIGKSFTPKKAFRTDWK
jgi:hypothetical protein